MSEPTTVPAADMAVLQEPKLRELVEELYGVANKWYYIGLHLDIPPRTLWTKSVETISGRRCA